MLRILHLSDLHLGEAGAWPVGDYGKSELIDEKQKLSRHDILRGTLDKLAEHLRSEDKNLDAIVVSGDVTVAGSREGFVKLGTLLGHLGDRNPGPTSTVVVPGNHDVTWGTKPDSTERYYDFVDVLRSEGYVTPLLEGVDISSSDGADIQHVHNPLLDLGDAVLIGMNTSNYCGTFESLGNLSESELSNLRVSAKENEALGRLLTTFDQLRLVDLCKVSKGQTEAMARRLIDLDLDGNYRLKIVVLHHQLLPVNLEEEVKPYETMTNLGFVRQWLADQGIHLVLHGHKHSPGTYIDFPGIVPLIRPGLQLGGGYVMVSSVATANRSKPNEIARLIEIDSPGKETRSLSIESIAPTYPKLQFSKANFTKVAQAVVPRSPVQSRIRLFEGTTVDDVYSQLLVAFPSNSYDSETDVICRVVKGGTCNRLPANYPVPEGEEPREWLRETVAWWQNPEPQLRSPQFNHGERIWRFASNVDQFSRALDELGRRPGTSRSVMILIDPQSSQGGFDLYPSLCLVQLRIPFGTGRLDCIGYFRKQQMRAWWPVNVGELASIQEKAIDKLSGIVAGEIVTMSATALGGSDRPRVVVPRVDRWSQDQTSTLWELALDTLDPDSPSTPELLDRWNRLFSDWRPGVRMERDGVPIALRGLDALAQAIDTCAMTFPNECAANLVTELRDLSRINHNYWNHDALQSDDGIRRAEFDSWQPTVNRAINRVLNCVNELIAR